MKKKSIYRYYSFGYNYYLFKNCSHERPVKVKEMVDKIEEYFSFLDELNLIVTKAAATELDDILQDIKNKPSDDIIPSDLSTKIEKALQAVDKTLDSELLIKKAYILTEKRFKLEYLLDDFGSLLAKDVFEKLPDIVQYDLNEAGKCIAFKRSTAAAFHLLRATEGTLRQYYSLLVKRNKLKEHEQMWGRMIEQLKKHRTKPPKKLLDSLDNIRYNDRNPTFHPMAKYDLDEAQNLLGVCIDSINQIMKDMQNRNKAVK